MELSNKLLELKEIIKQYHHVIVAYSGGVDSAFLLKMVIDTLGKENVLACIGVSDSLAKSELTEATEVAAQIGANLKTVYPEEMQNPNYLANPNNRCYYCKTELYSLLTTLANDEDYDAVFSGTNKDDMGDWRPGIEAGNEHKIISPLQLAGFTKDEIRSESKRLTLPTWDKPAMPCLSSRIAYGIPVTTERLTQIEQGEVYLKGLGLTNYRVRHHDTLVRIEVDANSLEKLTNTAVREELVTHFKSLGFTYITLDLQGFRSGSGNALLQVKKNNT